MRRSNPLHESNGGFLQQALPLDRASFYSRDELSCDRDVIKRVFCVSVFRSTNHSSSGSHPQTLYERSPQHMRRSNPLPKSDGFLHHDLAPPSDRAPFYSRDEVFYKLEGGCTDKKGYFWAEGFFLAIGGFRENPVGTYWDTMWVCNQRGAIAIAV